MISHNLFTMKFYIVLYISMTVDAPSIFKLKFLTVSVTCTRKINICSLLGIFVINLGAVHKEAFITML